MFDSTAFRVVIGEDSTLRWTGFYVQPSLFRVFFLILSAICKDLGHIVLLYSLLSACRYTLQMACRYLICKPSVRKFVYIRLTFLFI